MLLSVFVCFGELVFAFFPFVGLTDSCHRGSDRLSSLSDDHCHCVADLVFCPFGSALFSSVGRKPPLNPRISGRLFILE